MNRIVIIGCPGAGKSTFARKLAAKTGLPLYYLDMIWHRADRTVIIEIEKWITPTVKPVSNIIAQILQIFYPQT